jgi:hypothetical protein
MPFIKEQFSSNRLQLQMLNRLVRLLLGVMFLFTSAGASASPRCPTLGPAEIDYATLDPGISEPEEALTRIQNWTRSDRSTIDLNFTSKELWVRIRWNNPSPAGATCVLEIKYPFLDSLAFLIRKTEGWQVLTAGDREFKNGPLPYTRYPAFRFESLPGINACLWKWANSQKSTGQ